MWRCLALRRQRLQLLHQLQLRNPHRQRPRLQLLRPRWLPQHQPLRLHRLPFAGSASACRCRSCLPLLDLPPPLDLPLQLPAAAAALWILHTLARTFRSNGVRFQSMHGLPLARKLARWGTPTGIRVAVAWGYVGSESACAALESLNCLGGRVYGLTRR